MVVRLLKSVLLHLEGDPKGREFLGVKRFSLSVSSV
jgi:hypothetical protein